VNGFGALTTAVATMIFLISKFVDGAWVVVVAVPTFVLLFRRIHLYYDRAGLQLGVGTVPDKPEGKRTLVIVPISSISFLTEYAISEALSLGDEVVAISVVIDGGDDGERAAQRLHDQWGEWDPGVPLRVLHTEYSSVVDPIVAFIDHAREESDQQIVVLIPVVAPEHLRHRLLHNQIDVVLSAALRTRTDVVVARVKMPIRLPAVGDGSVEDGSDGESGETGSGGDGSESEPSGATPVRESPH
jgi:hypothetical protein